ncbi:32704_t:CDS:2 [Gigaspora margarita]|uniref:32704_t:CDS:1 n=1 Tax=Gigaspora margarita TaxID=4874 RepID=A0ABN7VBD9_GIGMA|nr:32704_t:CDS:2 [Gigaspora margarita]
MLFDNKDSYSYIANINLCSSENTSKLDDMQRTNLANIRELLPFNELTDIKENSSEYENDERSKPLYSVALGMSFTD